MFREYVYASGDKSEHALTAAAHIDVLTGCRIRDFHALTAFQQRVVQEVHQRLEQFERENEDILDAPFTSYGVNGVSMSFGSRLSQVGGVVIPADLYALLCTTGLCYPAI